MDINDVRLVILDKIITWSPIVTIFEIWTAIKLNRELNKTQRNKVHSQGKCIARDCNVDRRLKVDANSNRVALSRKRRQINIAQRCGLHDDCVYHQSDCDSEGDTWCSESSGRNHQLTSAVGCGEPCEDCTRGGRKCTHKELHSHCRLTALAATYPQAVNSTNFNNNWQYSW